MAKWWARAKTCSASLASRACAFTLCLFGGLARWSVRLHLCCALAVAAAHALAAHPLGEFVVHQLPDPARRLIDRNDELQRALVLPWVLLGAADALWWTACAIFKLFWLLGRRVCRRACRCLGPTVCRSLCKTRSKAVTTKEEKDSGPPKMSSAKVPTVPGQHLRRRTYPKIM